MFPHQEPGGREEERKRPPTKHLVQILRGGSSSSGFLIRNIVNRKPPRGGGFVRSKCTRNRGLHEVDLYFFFFLISHSKYVSVFNCVMLHAFMYMCMASNNSCDWVMSYVNESCHIYMSHVTYESVITCEWVMSHRNESCHLWMSLVTQIFAADVAANKSCYIGMSHVTYEWVMSHMNESWYEWVMSHRFSPPMWLRMSHVT